MIGQLVAKHKARGELNLTPLKFIPEMERPSDGPLLFPGKVLADAEGKRLFIADTGHNRIVVTDLDGKAQSRSATARKDSTTARSRRPTSTGRRECASTATRSTWPTPRTTRSGPST